VGGRATIHLLCDLFALFEGKYGYIEGGNLNSEGVAVETGELLSILKNDHPSGYTYDLTGALGYRFFLMDCTFMVAPMIGYSHYYNSYNLPNSDFPILPPNVDSATPFDVKFSDHFRGPWIGFDTHYCLFDCLKIFGSFRYEWLRYTAKSASEVSSFADNITLLSLSESSQKAYMYGPLFRVGADYFFCDCLFAGALFEYRYFEGHNGNQSGRSTSIITVDEEFFSLSTEKTTAKIPRLRWNSWLIELHVGLSF